MMFAPLLLMSRPLACCLTSTSALSGSLCAFVQLQVHNDITSTSNAFLFLEGPCDVTSERSMKRGRHENSFRLG